MESRGINPAALRGMEVPSAVLIQLSVGRNVVGSHGINSAAIREGVSHEILIQQPVGEKVVANRWTSPAAISEGQPCAVLFQEL